MRKWGLTNKEAKDEGFAEVATDSANHGGSHWYGHSGRGRGRMAAQTIKIKSDQRERRAVLNEAKRTIDEERARYRSTQGSLQNIGWELPNGAKAITARPGRRFLTRYVDYSFSKSHGLAVGTKGYIESYKVIALTDNLLRVIE